MLNLRDRAPGARRNSVPTLSGRRKQLPNRPHVMRGLGVESEIAPEGYFRGLLRGIGSRPVTDRGSGVERILGDRADARNRS